MASKNRWVLQTTDSHLSKNYTQHKTRKAAMQATDDYLADLAWCGAACDIVREQWNHSRLVSTQIVKCVGGASRQPYYYVFTVSACSPEERFSKDDNGAEYMEWRI